MEPSSPGLRALRGIQRDVPYLSYVANHANLRNRALQPPAALSAPAFSSARRHSSWPFCAAMKSGVAPRAKTHARNTIFSQAVRIISLLAFTMRLPFTLLNTGSGILGQARRSWTTHLAARELWSSGAWLGLFQGSLPYGPFVPSFW